MSMRGKTSADPREQGWIDLIAEHGFAINMVIDDDPNEPSGEPPFAYSLGAWESYGAPELIVFGLRRDVGSDMISHVMALHRGGRIREKRAKETIGFDACVRRGLSDGKVKFLIEEQALVLQTINGLRDAAQHHLGLLLV